MFHFLNCTFWGKFITKKDIKLWVVVKLSNMKHLFSRKKYFESLFINQLVIKHSYKHQISQFLKYAVHTSLDDKALKSYVQNVKGDRGF